MENELFDDLMQSLDEALAYAQGDKTKGRSQFITVSDNELAQRQLLWQKIDRLPEARLQLVDRYIDTLIEV
ncbi:MAG: hypothetical protein FWB87_15505 [Defluviitaleaceae bacterium]|nr:hypothetical protein [Defluviitaleaceae bacterium]